MKYKAKKAFTLLELIMVIAVIGIMTSLVLTAISSSRHTTELETAANQISASLRETQNYALTGRIEAGDKCTSYIFTGGNPNLESYRISGSGPTPGDCTFNMTQKITGGVSFQSTATVSFSAPHGDVLINDNIILTNSGNSIYICVNGVGMITTSWTGCP